MASSALVLVAQAITTCLLPLHKWRQLQLKTFLWKCRQWTWSALAMAENSQHRVVGDVLTKSVHKKIQVLSIRVKHSYSRHTLMSRTNARKCD